MIPASFDYVVVHSVDEAVAFLDQRGEDAEILAGGQSLIPLLRFRLAWPSVLIDINRIDSLEYIQETDGVLHIGALTRQAELESSRLVRERYPILFETATALADPVVRNWATVGGNIAHADPGNDHPATMLALGASVVAVSPSGERVIPIDEFFTDTSFETSRQANAPAPPPPLARRVAHALRAIPTPPVPTRAIPASLIYTHGYPLKGRSRPARSALLLLYINVHFGKIGSVNALHRRLHRPALNSL